MRAPRPEPRSGGETLRIGPLARAAGRDVTLALILLSIVANLLVLASPLFMMQVYDRVLSSGSVETLVALALITMAALGVYGALEAVRRRLLMRAAARIDDTIAGRVFEGAARSRHTRRGGAADVRDLDSLSSFVAGPALVALADLPWLPLFLIVLWLLHPLLAGLCAVGAIVLVGLTVAGEILNRPRSRSAQESTQHSSRFADAVARAAEPVAAMGMLGAVRARWTGLRADAVEGQGQSADTEATLLGAGRFVRLAIQTGILGTGAWLALSGEISPGSIIAAAIIATRALAPTEGVVAGWRGFLSARGAWERLAAAMAEAPPERADGVPLPRPAGRAEVRDLALFLPGRRDALFEALNFTVEPGEVLGVVGPSGSGKSSLARVVVGAWQADAGTVRLDGIDVASGAAAPWIGYLPQEVALLPGTVRENVERFAGGDPERVVEAARLAGAHRLVLELPEGYETPVGPGGVPLSGGQAQRIGLARAVYGDPALVVLDEPNAHLDAAGESDLRAAVAALKARGVAVMVIAHHPSILAVTDRIMVLSQGRIEALAPRDQVLQRYARPTAVAAGGRPAARPPAAANVGNGEAVGT